MPFARHINRRIGAIDESHAHRVKSIAVGGPLQINEASRARQETAKRTENGFFKSGLNLAGESTDNHSDFAMSAYLKHAFRGWTVIDFLLLAGGILTVVVGFVMARH